MKKILHLEPVLHEKIWGGTELRDQFGYAIPSDHTGECWAISGHPNGDCRVTNPEFGGQTLGQLFWTRRELFGNIPGDVFPLLVKIIDARQDLSIQVHPDDAYAKVHENGSLGKTECWYVLDSKPGTTVIIGHNAGTREEMRQMVAEGKWNQLLRQVPLRKGDFFQINPGCLHALKGGSLILETQQSSDVTYRFYDYDRLENGKKRELHIEKSLDVTTVPFVPDRTVPETETVDDAEITHLVTCPFYSVYRAVLHGNAALSFHAPFVNVSIIGGEGTLDGEPVKKGDHMVLTANYGPCRLEGNMELVYSYI